MRNKQRGSVFIIALALIVVLSMVIVTAAASTKIDRAAHFILPKDIAPERPDIKPGE